MHHSKKESKESILQKQYNSFKADVYTLVGQHPRNLFNFFYENNDIFEQISHEDMLELIRMHQLYLQRGNLAFWGGFTGVLFLDQIVFRFALPQIRFPFKRGRIALNLLKYIGTPLISYKICDTYFQKDVDEIFTQKTQKYNFNYEDFERVMKVFERVWMVGRYKEFVEKRTQFDFTGVPELENS